MKKNVQKFPSFCCSLTSKQTCFKSLLFANGIPIAGRIKINFENRTRYDDALWWSLWPFSRHVIWGWWCLRVWHCNIINIAIEYDDFTLWILPSLVLLLPWAFIFRSYQWVLVNVHILNVLCLVVSKVVVIDWMFWWPTCDVSW